MPFGEGGPAMGDGEFRLLRDLIHAHCGIFFRDDLKYVLERRLAPRLQLHGLAAYSEYHRFLRFDPGGAGELDEATDLLTTNETYFYREPHQLRSFEREILPVLARDRAAERSLRVLSAGCSTGEEPYTIAIQLVSSGLFKGWELEVVGADISRRCLAVAKAGSYGAHAFRSAEGEALRRWFHLRGGAWVVDDAIRSMVRFTGANLLDERGLATVSRVDAVFCRNVIIYFDLAARRRALRRLYDRLRPGGWLLMGHSESLLNVTADFELVHLTSDLVYRKPAGTVEGLP
jgi:chemotaxis protein methyltransferase CheR